MAENKGKYKTKDYVRRAQNNYRAKFDQINLVMPKGIKGFIADKTGQAVNVYIRELVLKDLKENYGFEMEE